jgi:hypothetical protein
MSTRFTIPPRLRSLPLVLGVVVLLFWVSALFRYDVSSCDGDDEIACVAFDRWFQKPVRLVATPNSESEEETANNGSEEEEEDLDRAREQERRREREEEPY